MTTKNEVRSTVEALIMALEALEGCEDVTVDVLKAITAIKEAMAAVPEAHKQSAEIPQSITCPFCESQHVPGWLHDYNMDRMKKPAPVAEPHKQQSASVSVDRVEPVAYAVYHRMGGSKTLHWPEQHSNDGDHNEYQLVPLYTSPPIEATPLASQRSVKPWVGLTDEEAIFPIENECLGRGDLVEAIEAKLREKNEPLEKNA